MLPCVLGPWYRASRDASFVSLDCGMSCPEVIARVFRACPRWLRRNTANANVETCTRAIQIYVYILNASIMDLQTIQRAQNSR